MTPTSEYRTIPLTQGQVAIVDAADYDWLNQWKWTAWRNNCTSSFYAVRSVRLENGRDERIYLHRLILGLEYGDRRHGDHVNHDTLDNRRYNLRIATPAQNQQNKTAYSNNKSGYKGVYKKKTRWCAEIISNGVKIRLGHFSTPESAAQAYQKAALSLNGEFAKW